MLAKQAWRILHGGESLLGRSLKAKYFPRGSLIDANIAHNPSFTWRSILAGKEILKQGIIWKVGNGRDIRIWKDRWIPSSNSSIFFDAASDYEQDMTVNNLILDDGIRWDFDLLSDLFPADVRSKIMSIPLARHREKDSQIWRYTTNGIYLVRSGYHIACHLRDLQNEEASSSAADSPIWRWIHNLKVPPKVAHFLWKCCWGIVPVATELCKKQVDCDVICRRCGEAEESIEHVLRDCCWSNFLWKISPLRFQFTHEDRELNMRQWLETIVVIDNHKVHQMVAVFLWNIWRSWNELVFENKHTSHMVVMEEAMKLVGELNTVPGKAATTNPMVADEGWKKPQHSYWNVNVDAALDGKGYIGLGLTIRDERGKIVVCRSKKMPSNISVEAAEGLACQEGLILAKEFGGNKLFLETDCRGVNQKLYHPQSDFSSMADIIHSIFVEARFFESTIFEARFFESTIFSWARRTANKLAHSLAFLAISNDSFSFYTGLVPDCILLGVPRFERFDF